jgi:hypothetical protein
MQAPILEVLSRRPGAQLLAKDVDVISNPGVKEVLDGAAFFQKRVRDHGSTPLSTERIIFVSGTGTAPLFLLQTTGCDADKMGTQIKANGIVRRIDATQGFRVVFSTRKHFLPANVANERK